MNYRRGLQRLYAALTVAWVSAMLLTLPPDRIKAWSVPSNGPSPTEFLGFERDHPMRYAVDLFLINNLPNPSWNSRLQKFTWLICILAVPPVLGYAILFGVAPWVYRGFKPATHI